MDTIELLLTAGMLLVYKAQGSFPQNRRIKDTQILVQKYLQNQLQIFPSVDRILLKEMKKLKKLGPERSWRGGGKRRGRALFSLEKVRN